jgi:hypothetical protein
MEGRVNISTDDLLDALQAAMGPVDTCEASTVQDLVEKTGWGRTKVTGTLGRMAKAGRLEVVRVRRLALDGRIASLPAYRLKP